ncbi:MAG: FAD-binding oxidoreductase [Myxococcales bacterium]|nr:FAD-binding oxidoreductase [Myxococcales bacterium]MCB9580157.1 FAD-binding oxidoreductase [Polyangiaceae bacterium]
MRIVVLGAGIAGLSTAHALCARGAEVVVLEREPYVFSHSSGRNAAIYRPVEDSTGIAELARVSARHLDALAGTRDRWLDQRGLLLVAADAAPIHALERVAERDGVNVQRLDVTELHTRAPALAGGHVRDGLWVPDGGVLDPHAIGSLLASAIRDAGGRILLGADVGRVLMEGGRVAGVVLSGGETFAADAVVLAAGAWAEALGAAAGASLPLTPIRRHLVILEPSAAVDPRATTVWDVGLQAYFRPESGGLLASPCDELAWRPEVPAPDPAALELLAERLRTLAPGLAESRVRRSWACLRTFAPDRRLVIGADPRVTGLHWVAGLGGYGMSSGVGAGELAARVIFGEQSALSAALAPARLVT